MRAAVPGTRNTALFTEHDIVRLLRHACAAHIGIDGFTAPEADRAITNGLRYGRQRPRTTAPS